MSQQCPKTGSIEPDKAIQLRRANRSDQYQRDVTQQRITFLSSLGVKWSQVQILSARQEKQALTCGNEASLPLRLREVTTAVGTTRRLSGRSIDSWGGS